MTVCDLLPYPLHVSGYSGFELLRLAACAQFQRSRRKPLYILYRNNILYTILTILVSRLKCSTPCVRSFTDPLEQTCLFCHGLRPISVALFWICWFWDKYQTTLCSKFQRSRRQKHTSCTLWNGLDPISVTQFWIIWVWAVELYKVGRVFAVSTIPLRK